MSKNIDEQSAIHLSEELQVNRRLLRSVFDRLPGMIYVHDLVNDVNLYRSWTFKRILGLKDAVEMNSGRAIRSLAHPDDIRELRVAKEKIQKAADDECVKFSYRLKHAEGHWVWFRSEEYVYERNTDGRPIKTLGYVTDITNEIERQSDLEQANKLNRLLLDCAQLLSFPTNEPKEALSEIVEKISNHFGAVCDISLLDEQTEIIQPLAIYYKDVEIKREITALFATHTVGKGEGMVGKVIDSGEELVISPVPRQMVEGRSASPKIEPISFAYMPISGSAGTIGSLNLTRLVGSREFSEPEIIQVRKIAQYISVFVQNSILQASQNEEIRKRKQAERQLQLDKRWAEYKLEITALLGSSDLSLEDALQQICTSVSLFFNAVVDVQLTDRTRDVISLVALSHENKQIEQKIKQQLSVQSLKVGEGMIGSVLESGTELYLEKLPEQIEKSALQNGFPEEILPLSLAYIPLRVGEKIIGTLDFTRLRQDTPISLYELSQMRDLAVYVSGFVENRLLQKRQEDEIRLRREAEKNLEKKTKTLERLEREHREILDAIPIQVARISKDLRYTFVNEAHRASRTTKKDLVGKKVETVLGKRLSEKLKPQFDKVLGGDAVTFEFEGKMADGRIRYLSIALAPYKLDNEVVGFYSCSIDLTDKVLAEQQVKITEERFESLSLNSGDAFFFHDEDQNILDVNQVASEMLGYSRAELLALKAKDIDPRWSQDIYQRFLKNLEENFPQTFETSVVAEDGRRIPVESRFVKRVEDGRMYIQSLVRDRSEKRAQEKRLVESEQNLRLVFDNVEDYIATIDINGIIQSINKTDESVRPEDVIGSSIYNFFSSEEAVNEVKNKFPLLVKTGRAFEVEDQFKGAQGEQVFSIKYNAVFHEGSFLKAVVILRDITAERMRERSVMTAAIRGQEQERKRLGAELHDGIGQVLTALAFELSRTKQSAENLSLPQISEPLQRSGESLQAAIEEIRNISHNLMPDVLESFGLDNAIRQTCNHMKSQSDMEISFECVDAEEKYSPEVEKNLYRITQELLNNAQKHAACSRVFVTLMDHGDVLTLSVEDDGCGFDLDGKLSGIGLQNVRSRVKLINGKVDIESSENTGTLVNIEVPKTLLQ